MTFENTGATTPNLWRLKAVSSANATLDGVFSIGDNVRERVSVDKNGKWLFGWANQPHSDDLLLSKFGIPSPPVGTSNDSWRRSSPFP